MEELPPGRFREQLETLLIPARERAIQRLQEVHFTDLDLETLQVDAEGNVYYADPAPEIPASDPEETDTPPVSASPLPMTPFPSSLIFHSKPGAPNTLYLDFDGEEVRNSVYNNSLGRTVIPAVPFNTDGDATTFGDAEQLAIKRIWQRVSEDYAPFDIDVTTERPSTLGSRVGHALITRSADANEALNPSASGGGTAQLNVFGSSNYAYYRPAWVYFNNLASRDDYISEAISHEFGHNLGLTHDGLTSGSSYYGGHGSGETSWGPIMGTGYTRNVSQWCKGDYYQANNSQDDLATIASKLSYRADDHGGTVALATPLTLVQSTNILSTTPDTDPTNANASNKGILERNTDVDAFSFITGDGSVTLEVKPVRMPVNTLGGNLDVFLELYDNSGRRLLTANPDGQTHARIETSLEEGVYYLVVRNAGDGSPTSSTPTGYTAYGSIGQYFINGTVVKSDFTIPPQADLQITDITLPGSGPKQFTVTYTDDSAIDVSTIDDQDVRVVGPSGYDRLGRLISINGSSDGTPRIATYQVDPPNGRDWTASDNGNYAVWMQPDQVGDVEGTSITAKLLGQFNVNIAQVIYLADMNDNPGWKLEGSWEYGVPSDGTQGPSSGLTGDDVLGYNLDGDYENRLSLQFATTTTINCSGTISLTLRFQRWLRLKVNDTAVLQVSINGTTWTDVWSTTQPVSDTSWREVQYPLPSWAAGSSTLQLRWGIASGPSQTDIGWNIDDVQILGGGNLDSSPPVPALSVGNITTEDYPAHAFLVTYTDQTAVRLSSLNSTDAYVTGPNGYSNLVTLANVSATVDTSPMVATYSIPAPGGFWDATDNGSYQIVLRDNEVEDVLNNVVPEVRLGGFQVQIPTRMQTLVVSTNNLTVPEGGQAALTVQLAEMPATTVTMTVTRVSGDIDLAVQTGGSHEFNASNWSTPFPVTFTAMLDMDKLNGMADFECRIDGADPVTILAVEQDTTFDVTLTTSVNHPTWGSVTPSTGVYPSGTTIQLVAAPATYFQFIQWSGTMTETNNPLNVTLLSNTMVRAEFAEILTTNHPTPHWWLASYGYTQDLENSVELIGANGLPLWQSYLAGLNPKDPASQLKVFVVRGTNESELILSWNTVSNRSYTLWTSANSGISFAPVLGASNLPWNIQSFSIRSEPSTHPAIFRIYVANP